MKVVVSAKAYSDLQRIYLFHAERDQIVAGRTIDGIHRQFLNLSRFPKLGRSWPEVEQYARPS